VAYGTPQASERAASDQLVKELAVDPTSEPTDAGVFS